MQLRRLPTLIAVIDHLERRLYGGKMPAEDVLSDQELLDFLYTIGQQYVVDSTSNSPESQRLRLEDDLKRLLGAQSRQRILSIRHTALLQITEVVFRCIESSRDVHAHVYAALQGLQIGFTRALITDPATLVYPDQQHRKFLEFLIKALKGYDQYSGRRARALVGESGRRVAETIVSAKETEVCQIARRTFAGLLQRYNRESLIYEKSLTTKEQGLAARDDVRLLVNREILAAVGGQSLPPDLLRFFQEVWSKYLHVTYLREGPQSDTWQRGIGVIPTLVHSLYIQDPYEMLQFYQEDLSQALAVVHSGAESIHQDLQLTQSVLAYLDDLPLQLIQKGKKPDIATFQEVPAPAQLKTNDTSGAVLSMEDIQALNEVQLGDWYLIRTDEQEVRGKLIQKDITLGYCLFANFSGIKAARLDANGLAKALASGTLAQIDTSTIIEQAMEAALTQLEDHLQRLESKVHIAEQERERAKALLDQERERAAAIAEDAARLQRMREDMQREESEVRERERKAAEAQTQAREISQRQEQEQVFEKVLRDVQLLQPGGWLELLAKDNVKHICKLALKLKSTQKMIFVDRFGQKMAEMRPAELAARIVEGSARIIDHGTAFEDTLQSLIADRSGKINVD